MVGARFLCFSSQSNGGKRDRHRKLICIPGVQLGEHGREEAIQWNFKMEVEQEILPQNFLGQDTWLCKDSKAKKLGERVEAKGP